MLLRTLSALVFLGLPAHADVWSFGTPSGNIECIVGEGFNGSDIECTIYKRNQRAKVSALAACPTSRGITFFMQERGGVQGSCTAPGARATGTQGVAEYNVEGKFGGFTCYSATSGLQCRNLDGHGFHLSRNNQQVF
ncbi:hypothetical protein Z945_3070 [Sulfitobacter noctilucae]|uniref:DUF6636 domain-containing protein n=1 Tax=Sulfitobacter noctilucae TaxID=1342302 RepID=UPI00046B0853|nr:DUF6636 domain-containing protein [Sulfitobacter noctilucae]KIN70607.1 hypothetical protein Z945_3070 [Sulfitobacter noctilucae]